MMDLQASSAKKQIVAISESRYNENEWFLQQLTTKLWYYVFIDTIILQQLGSDLRFSCQIHLTVNTQMATISK